MCSKPVSFLFWSQLANSHCNIALEKEENPKQQNLYAHYLLTKRIDPMIVVKNSIICTFSRFHKHTRSISFISLLIIVFYLGCTTLPLPCCMVLTQKTNDTLFKLVPVAQLYEFCRYHPLIVFRFVPLLIL